MGDFCTDWGVPDPWREVNSAGIGRAHASSILGNVLGLGGKNDVLKTCHDENSELAKKGIKDSSWEPSRYCDA